MRGSLGEKINQGGTADIHAWALGAARRSGPAPAGLNPSSRAWPSMRLLSVAAAGGLPSATGGRSARGYRRDAKNLGVVRRKTPVEFSFPADDPSAQAGNSRSTAIVTSTTARPSSPSCRIARYPLNRPLMLARTACSSSLVNGLSASSRAVARASIFTRSFMERARTIARGPVSGIRPAKSNCGSSMSHSRSSRTGMPWRHGSLAARAWKIAALAKPVPFVPPPR